MISPYDFGVREWNSTYPGFEFRLSLRSPVDEERASLMMSWVENLAESTCSVMWTASLRHFKSSSRSLSPWAESAAGTSFRGGSFGEGGALDGPSLSALSSFLGVSLTSGAFGATAADLAEPFAGATLETSLMKFFSAGGGSAYG